MSNSFSLKTSKSKSFRDWFFYMVKVQLWRESAPTLLQYGYFLAAEIQLISILVFGQYHFLSQDPGDTLAKFLKELCRILSVQDLFIGTGATTGFAVMYIISYSYIAILLGTFSYTVYKYFYNPTITIEYHRTLAFSLKLFPDILFWIINTCFFYSITNRSPERELFFGISSSNTALLATNIMFLSYGCISVFILAFCGYDPLRTSNTFSCRNSNFQVLGVVFKLIMIPIITSTNSGSLNKWFFIILSLLVISFRHFKLTKDYPFYHYPAMKLACLFSGIELGLVILNLVIFILKGGKATTPSTYIYSYMLILPILIKIVFNKIRYTIQEYQRKPDSEIRTESQLYKKYFAIYQSLESGNIIVNSTNKVLGNSELLFLLSSAHNNPNLVNNLLSKSSKTTNNDLDMFIAGRALSQMATSLSYNTMVTCLPNIPKGEKIKIFLAYEIYKKDQNFHRAINVLMSINTKKLNFMSSIIFSLLHDYLEEELIKAYVQKSDGIVNLKSLIDFEYNSNILMDSLVSNTKRHIEFWEYYKKPDFYMQKLVKKSIEMENQAEKITKLWHQFTATYGKHAARWSSIYCKYLNQIRNAPYTAIKLRQQYGNFEDLRAYSEMNAYLCDSNLYDKNNIILYVSMNKHRLGKILYVSQNTKELLGWDHLDLKEKNIRLLMNNSYQERHQDYWANMLDFGSKTHSLAIISTQTFIKTKSGYLTPSTIYVALAPYITKDLIYLCVIRPLQLKSNFMVINSDGKIDGVTMELGRSLSLEADKDINIKDILTEFTPLKEDQHEDSPLINQRTLIREVINDNKSCLDLLMSNEHRSAFVSFIYKDKTQTYLATLKVDKAHKKFIILMELTYEGISIDDLRDSKSSRDSKIDYLLDMEEIPSERVTMNWDYSPTTKKDRPGVHTLLECSIMQQNYVQETSQLPIIATKTSTPKRKGGLTITYNTFGDFSKTNQGADRTMNNFTTQFEQFEEGERFQQFNISSSNHSKFQRNKSKQTKMESLKELKLTNPKEVKIQHAKIMENASVSSHSTNLNLTNKVERSIYLVPKDISLNILYYIAVGFIAFAITLHIVYMIESGSNIDLLSGNADILRASTQRLYSTLDMEALTRGVFLIDAGMWDDARLASVGLPSLKGFYPTVMGDRARAISNYNNEVRSNLSLIEKSLRKQIYDFKVEINETESNITRLGTTFELSDRLVQSGLRLANTPANKWTNTSHDVNFIHWNVMDDNIIANEEMTTILLSDIDHKLGTNVTLISIFFGLLCVFGTIIILLLILEIRKFRKARNSFIEILLRIDEDDLDAHLKLAQQLISIIHNEYIEVGKTFKSKKSKADGHQEKNRIVRKRYSHLKGINVGLIKVMFFSFLWVGLFILGFILSYTITLHYNDELKHTVEERNELNVILYRFNLLIGGITDYVGSNGTKTMKRKPIGEALEDIFNQLIGTERFFLHLLEYGNPVIHELVNGDLCKTTLFPQPFPFEVCINSGKGAARQGIIGMNSYALSAVRTLKDAFEYSDRSFAKQAEILSMPIFQDVELGIFAYLLSAYNVLEAQIKGNLKILVDEYKQVSRSFLIPTIILDTILGLLLWGYIWRRLDSERTKWRKMFRHIPYEMIHTNKVLRSYLISNCDHLLDSVTF